MVKANNWTIKTIIYNGVSRTNRSHTSLPYALTDVKYKYTGVRSSPHKGVRYHCYRMSSCKGHVTEIKTDILILTFSFLSLFVSKMKEICFFFKLSSMIFFLFFIFLLKLVSSFGHRHRLIYVLTFSPWKPVVFSLVSKYIGWFLGSFLWYLLEPCLLILFRKSFSTYQPQMKYYKHVSLCGVSNKIFKPLFYFILRILVIRSTWY